MFTCTDGIVNTYSSFSVRGHCWPWSECSCNIEIEYVRSIEIFRCVYVYMLLWMPDPTVAWLWWESTSFAGYGKLFDEVPRVHRDNAIRLAAAGQHNKGPQMYALKCACSVLIPFFSPYAFFLSTSFSPSAPVPLCLVILVLSVYCRNKSNQNVGNVNLVP